MLIAYLWPASLLLPNAAPSGQSRRSVAPRCEAAPALDFLNFLNSEGLAPKEPEPEPEPEPAEEVSLAKAWYEADTVISWYDFGIRLNPEDAAEATAVAEAAFEDAASAEPFSVLTSPQPAFDCEATTHEAMNEAMSGECDTERMMRSVLCGWKNEAGKLATIERLAEFEDGFTTLPDAAAIKAELVGTWKLLVTSEEDGVLGGGGVSGTADDEYKRVVAQYQSFRLPSPDDILTGNVFFMETSEVVIDVRLGSANLATVKGGFSITPSATSDGYHDVTEQYARVRLAHHLSSHIRAPIRHQRPD